MLCIKNLKPLELDDLLAKYGLEVNHLTNQDEIPGSYWGAPEAGIISNKLHIRPDTPVHSALHEACHYVCMDTHRREKLHTDTGGDYDEENAVCYLQIILSNYLSCTNETTLCKDMDDWGYTFRLGSAHIWYNQDAEDAFNWLVKHRIINTNKVPTWNIRR